MIIEAALAVVAVKVNHGLRVPSFECSSSSHAAERPTLRFRGELQQQSWLQQDKRKKLQDRLLCQGAEGMAGDADYADCGVSLAKSFPHAQVTMGRFSLSRCL